MRRNGSGPLCRKRVCHHECGTSAEVVEQIDLGEADALAKEIEAFLASVRTRARPAVTGEGGLAALELAERILAPLDEADAA